MTEFGHILEAGETGCVEQLDVWVQGGAGEEIAEIKDDSLGWGLAPQ